MHCETNYLNNLGSMKSCLVQEFGKQQTELRKILCEFIEKYIDINSYNQVISSLNLNNIYLYQEHEKIVRRWGKEVLSYFEPYREVIKDEWIESEKQIGLMDLYATEILNQMNSLVDSNINIISLGSGTGKTDEYIYSFVKDKVSSNINWYGIDVQQYYNPLFVGGQNYVIDNSFRGEYIDIIQPKTGKNIMIGFLSLHHTLINVEEFFGNMSKGIDASIFFEELVNENYSTNKDYFIIRTLIEVIGNVVFQYDWIKNYIEGFHQNFKVKFYKQSELEKMCRIIKIETKTTFPENQIIIFPKG